MGAGGEDASTPGAASLADAPLGTVLVDGVRLCAGRECAEGEVCCLLNGECVESATVSDTCVTSEATSEPSRREVDRDAPYCASDADCQPDEYCNNHLFCLRLGYCASRTNCPASVGTGPPLCGCDGITYPNPQSACFAGARVIGEGACGERFVQGAAGGIPETSYTPCASPADCGDGEACCAITGRCYDEDRPAICAEPPEGTYRACIDNGDCNFDDLCQGRGCGTPGGCVTVSTDDCTGLLEPVCGCDGQTYTSAGCAAAALTRVMQSGECPEALPATD